MIASASYVGMRSSTTFAFQESSLPDMPEKAISFPSENELTHKFLIRQSSILSSEAASRVLVFLVTAFDACLLRYLEANKELANLYEMSSDFSLTEAGSQRVLELRSVVLDKKKELLDLQLLFAYVRKLMDLNASVNFLVGEEHVSDLTSERIHSTSQHFEKQMESFKMAELDLAQAQAAHIKKSLNKETETETVENEKSLNTKEEAATVENENSSNHTVETEETVENDVLSF